jgi:hypothetical protein
MKEAELDYKDDLEDFVLTKINSTKGGPTKNKNSNKSDTNNDVIAAKVAELLVPLLAKQLDVMLKKTLRSIATVLEEESAAALQNLQRTNLQLRFQLDKQEQYSRRESIRIQGIKEEEEEEVEEKVFKMFSDMGCDLKKEDVSAVHRTGKKKRDQDRHILVKFVSRRNKQHVMKKKRALKELPQYRKVYVNDDLTALRMRLLSYVKKVDSVERAQTTPDGRIRCEMKKKRPGSDQREVIIIESPDDLFKIGADLDFEFLGLTHLTC